MYIGFQDSEAISLGSWHDDTKRDMPGFVTWEHKSALTSEPKWASYEIEDGIISSILSGKGTWGL